MLHWVIVVLFQQSKWSFKRNKRWIIQSQSLHHLRASVCMLSWWCGCPLIVVINNWNKLILLVRVTYIWLPLNTFKICALFPEQLKRFKICCILLFVNPWIFWGSLGIIFATYGKINIHWAENKYLVDFVLKQTKLRHQFDI